MFYAITSSSLTLFKLCSHTHTPAHRHKAKHQKLKRKTHYEVDNCFMSQIGRQLYVKYYSFYSMNSFALCVLSPLSLGHYKKRPSDEPSLSPNE